MVRAFLAADDGQGLVEYALIIALVALAVIAAMQSLGNKSNNSLTNASNALSMTTPAPLGGSGDP